MVLTQHLLCLRDLVRPPGIRVWRGRDVYHRSGFTLSLSLYNYRMGAVVGVSCPLPSGPLRRTFPALAATPFSERDYYGRGWRYCT